MLIFAGLDKKKWLREGVTKPVEKRKGRYLGGLPVFTLSVVLLQNSD